MTNLAIYSAVVILGATPVLLVAALAVRFAGTARILNVLDYDGVENPSAINRNMGNRLLLLPLGSLLCGVFALMYPSAAGIFFAGFVALLFACVGSIVWTTSNVPHKRLTLPQKN